MTATAAPAADRRRQLLGWTAAVGVAAAWLAAYQLNRPWWDLVVHRWAGLDPASRVGSSVHFFLYDTVKILLLLAAVIFVVTVLRSFVTVERTRALLSGRRQGIGNVAAAGLGVATPFCSCSAVPVFLGFVRAGVPLGVTFSFLVASPMVDGVAITLLWSQFGWQVALLYTGTGLVLAVVAGLVLGRLRLERWLEPIALGPRVPAGAPGAITLTWADRARDGLAEVRSVVGRIWPYLLVGIGLGALVHGWVPEDLLARWAGPDNPLAVPAAVLLGIPLYSNVAGVLPLVGALQAKGVAIGTVLAFVMAVVALSVPELVLLRRALRPPLLAVFAATVGTGILLVGFLFNALLA